MAALMLLTANGAPSTEARGSNEVDVRFEGLRSTKGMIRACLTREPKFFPHCEKDPASYKQSVAARTGALLVFSDVAPGDYALTVLHDENQNFRADMMLGIPREGVGFSRNPALIMGPPKFDAVRFRVPASNAGERVAQVVRLKYFL